jgi:hypothetical protein
MIYFSDSVKASKGGISLDEVEVSLQISSLVTAWHQ